MNFSMWPLPRMRDELVTIVINSTHLSLGIIKKNFSSNAPFMLSIYRSIPIQYSVHKKTIYNAKFLETHIHSFIKTYGLEDAFFSICIGGEQIDERLVMLHTTLPTHDDFSYFKLHTLAWDYCYLFPHERGEFVFSISGIQQELLLQYQLLILSLGINVVTLTTQFNSLFSLYRYMKGSAFRQASLAQDMYMFENRFERYFTTEMCNRIVQTMHPVDQEILLAMIGLYCMEKGNNEKN